MRHLHYRRSDPGALCGMRGQLSVHVTKARKTDCPDCRAAFRWNITAGRRRRKALVDRDLAVDALRAAASSLRDLAHGWPERELHEPLRITAARAYRVARRLERDVPPQQIKP